MLGVEGCWVLRFLPWQASFRVERGVEGVFVLLLDAPLQLQHHGAGGIDNLYAVLLRQLVGLRRFAVSSQEHLDVVELAHLVVVDGDESELCQAVALHAVVHNVAQAVELVALGQFFLCLADGCRHTEAKSAAAVYLYLHG